jgi:hypothetical protein
MGILSYKCPYTKCCRLYDKESYTCNETGGEYYGPGRMAGCGRELQLKGKKAYCYKEPDIKEIAKSEKNKWLAIAICFALLCLIGVVGCFIIGG